MNTAQCLDAFHRNSADSSGSERPDQLCSRRGGGRGEDTAEKHCVPRVCWQMALASVVVIMAALLRAFVWPWGKLNGSIFVSHPAKWWHSQISNPALSRCSNNGRKKQQQQPKKIQFQLVLTEKVGVSVKLFTRPKSDYKADFILVLLWCHVSLWVCQYKKANWVCFLKTTDVSVQP